MGEDISQAVLRDWRNAPISKRLRAALAFIEKLTLAPHEIEAGDMEPLRAEGLSDAAIEDTIHVTVLFNIIDRIADSMGFAIPSVKGFEGMASVLLKRGY